MSAFFKFFAERHIQAILFTTMIILLGLGTLTRMKRDTFPEVDFGTVVITTRYPGASPEDVELNVTNEIEEEIKGVSQIDNFVSYSMENISIITVTIDLEADDINEVKNDIREAVNRVTDLPEEVTEAPQIVEFDSQEFPIIEVGVSGDVPYRNLREAARLFKKNLENVQGVSRVGEFWYLDREIQIKVAPDAIQHYQIPLQEVATAISRRNIRSTGGTFESYTDEKTVVTLAQFQDAEEVRDVVVRTTFESPAIRVKDLANIEDGFEEPRVRARMNGVPAITFQVLKKESADVVRTVDRIRKMANEEQKTMPEGIKILFTSDSSYYVTNRFNVVLTNGAIGLTLVLLVLTVFLSLRTAFWVALSIPVALLGTIFLLPLFDVYLDIITLTAMIIVIGIIVDDGIIVSENIVQRREKGDSAVVAAAEGIREVAKPVITTLLTTFLAFAPMFFMTGVMGEVVTVIPLVISLALLISLFEMVLALPAHLGAALRKMKIGAAGSRGWFTTLRSRFNRIMVHVLRFRYVVIACVMVLFAASIWYGITFMRFVLFPTSAADIFSVYLEMPVGSSLQRTADKVKEVEQIIAKLPESELGSFATRIGTLGERQPGESERWAFIRVNLTPFAERDRTADVIVEDLRQKARQIEGFEDLYFNIDSGGPPVGQAITLRLVGSDDRQREVLTDSVIAHLSELPGTKDLDRNDKAGKQQVQIKLDYERLSRLGLSVQDAAQTVRLAYDGEVVTSVRYGEEDVDFRVMADEQARDGASYLSELLIPNNEGRLITMAEFAHFDVAPGQANYYHYNGERSTMITGDIAEEMTTPVEVTNSVLNHFDLDENWPGMRFIIGGQAEETGESLQSLYIAFVMAVIGIYFLLVLLFDSFTQPFIVMVAVPFGIMAVIIAFALHAEPLGFLAMMGLVGLSGVVVNDSLVMVSHINNLRAENPDRSVLENVSQGTADRLRAIIMTTLTTVVGLLPLAYGLGGSDPFIAPMALALGYGLLFSTPLTLMLVPSLYLVRTDITGFVRRIGERRKDKE